MDRVPGRALVRLAARLVVPLAFVAALVLATPVGLVLAQIDPQVRDRVVPAVVEIAILLDVTENELTEPIYLAVGSGTIISPDGLILTNHHVVDMTAHRAQLDAWEAQAANDEESLAFILNDQRVLILGTDGASVPQPKYSADVVAEDQVLDLAILRITGDENGAILSDTDALPFVSLGDSSSVRQGDPVDLFGYPMIGGDTLTYTNGVVSGFNFEQDDGPAWITTNATMGGGSSGGAAIDGEGQLIGIPTQGTELDCRPGDTNRDGTIDAEDVGCIPVGGSIGLLRPINLARDLLARSGVALSADPRTATTDPVTTTLEPTPTVTTLLALTPTPLPDDHEVGPTAPPAPSLLPHNVEGLWEDASYLAAYGVLPPAIAEACAVSPIYSAGDRVIVGRGAEIRPRGLSGAYSGESLGWVQAGTTVEISGSLIESGDCDHWPVRVVSEEGVSAFEDYLVPEGRDVVQVGATGMVSEIAFQPRDT